MENAWRSGDPDRWAQELSVIGEFVLILCDSVIGS